MHGGVGLIRVLCLGGFVLLLLVPYFPSHRDRRGGLHPDSPSHRRLMRELQRYE